jgi:hypothetical protein
MKRLFNMKMSEGGSCYHPIIYGNHLMTWILFVSGDLVHK